MVWSRFLLSKEYTKELINWCLKPFVFMNMCVVNRNDVSLKKMCSMCNWQNCILIAAVLRLYWMKYCVTFTILPLIYGCLRENQPLGRKAFCTEVPSCGIASLISVNRYHQCTLFNLAWIYLHFSYFYRIIHFLLSLCYN